MDPISEEYFYTLELVKEGLASFKRDQTELKHHVAKLFRENKTLTADLRDSLLKKDYELSEKGVHDLEQKLLSANAAKETAIKLWQEAMLQLEKQDELLIGKKSLVESERNEVGKSIENMREQYKKGMLTLSSELLNYRSDLSSIKQELQHKNVELEQNKSEVKRLNDELSFNRQQLTVFSAENIDLQKKSDSLQVDLLDKSNSLKTTKEELDVIKTENFKLATLTDDLKKQVKSLKCDIATLEQDAKDSLFAAQKAILEKKEIAYREEQYLKEIKMIKSSAGIDSQKLELKFSQKMKEVQEQNAKHVKSLMLEIEQLIQDNGEKQGLFERVEREKKALDSKLQLLCEETSSSFPTTSVFDDLCKRLTAAEKARDAFELRVKSLHNDVEELRTNREQDMDRFTKEKNILKERLAKLSNDFNQSLADKIKFNNESTGLKKKCQELEKQLRLKEERHTQEVSALRDEANRKQQSLNEMLHSVEDNYKTVCNELQTLLESQFKISNKWKEETEELISQSESRLIELCDTIAHLQFQNNDLVTALQQNNPHRQILDHHLFREQ